MRQMSRMRMDARKAAPTRCSAGPRSARREPPRVGGNQARLRALRGAAATLNPNGALSGEILTVDPAPSDVAAPTAEASGPTQAAPAQGAAGPSGAPSGCVCEMRTGPSYSPLGTIPATPAGGRKSASFDMDATFVNDPAAGKLPSCCHVRQFIKWDSAFAAWNGGPPHAGFPAGTGPDTWIEDRGSDDTERYGYRWGPHSVPFPSCGDEYKTGARRDTANGDHFCGNDVPVGPPAMTGTFKFQLVVFDSPGRPVARSSVITVVW